MRSLMALGFGGILIVFAGLFFKPQFVIPKSKISLILCAIAPKIFVHCLSGHVFPQIQLLVWLFAN